MFKIISVYTGESKNKKNEDDSQLIRNILTPPCTEPELRDEIYCQLVKQLTLNTKSKKKKKDVY